MDQLPVKVELVPCRDGGVELALVSERWATDEWPGRAHVLKFLPNGTVEANRMGQIVEEKLEAEGFKFDLSNRLIFANEAGARLSLECHDPAPLKSADIGLRAFTKPEIGGDKLYISLSNFPVHGASELAVTLSPEEGIRLIFLFTRTIESMNALGLPYSDMQTLMRGTDPGGRDDWHGRY